MRMVVEILLHLHYGRLLWLPDYGQCWIDFILPDFYWTNWKGLPIYAISTHVNFKCAFVHFSVVFFPIFHNFLFFGLIFPVNSNSLPWDRETPLGYFGEIWFGTVSGQPYFLLNGVILLLFISMCLHHRAFFAIFQHNLRDLDKANRKRDIKATKYFICELIRFHSMVKGWIEINLFSVFSEECPFLLIFVALFLFSICVLGGFSNLLMFTVVSLWFNSSPMLFTWPVLYSKWIW